MINYGLRKPVDRNDMFRLLAGNKFPDDIFTKPLDKIKPGMSFVLSGDFLCHGGRSLVERAINLAGCVVRKKVSGVTDALILGTNVSSSYSLGTYGAEVSKAQELNIKKHKDIRIVREMDFLNLLSESNEEVARYIFINKRQIEYFWQNCEDNVIDLKSGFTSDQLAFVKAVGTKRNVWLTGQAGTGKSFVLNALIRKLSKSFNIAIAASTGIAALNVNGVTLHKLLHMLPGAEFDETYLRRLKRENYLVDYDVVVIDEISMCSMALFDVFGYAVGLANKVRKTRQKPPLQVVVVGDFGQLPPVVKRADVGILQDKYGFKVPSWYCFLSKYWELFNFQKVELNRSIRQRDSHFVAALNSVRFGDYVSLKWIEFNSSKKRLGTAVMICGTNEEANYYNMEHLRSLRGPSVTFNAITDGEVDFKDLIIDRQAIFKVGARVMALQNQEGYVNGSMGFVEAINANYVSVRFDNGYRAVIQPTRWSIRKPVLYNGRWSVQTVGYVTQIPLKLAKAITCHKSQGKTFDAVNILPSFWDNGQMYTAISRAKSVDELFVDGGFSGHAFATSELVIDFMTGMTRTQIIRKYANLDNVKGRISHFDESKLVKEESVDSKKSSSKTTSSKTSGKRPVEMVDENGNILKVFESIAAAARFAGCTDYAIRKVLNDRDNYVAGYRWRDKW